MWATGRLCCRLTLSGVQTSKAARPPRMVSKGARLGGWGNRGRAGRRISPSSFSPCRHQPSRPGVSRYSGNPAGGVHTDSHRSRERLALPCSHARRLPELRRRTAGLTVSRTSSESPKLPLRMCEHVSGVDGVIALLILEHMAIELTFPWTDSERSRYDTYGLNSSSIVVLRSAYHRHPIITKCPAFCPERRGLMSTPQFPHCRHQVSVGSCRGRGGRMRRRLHLLAQGDVASKCVRINRLRCKRRSRSARGSCEWRVCRQAEAIAPNAAQLALVLHIRCS